MDDRSVPAGSTPAIRRVRRASRLACLALGCMAVIAGCESPVMPTSAQVGVASRMRYPVAGQYRAILRAARQIPMVGGLRWDGAQGSFAACPGSAGRRERYQVIGGLAAADRPRETARFVAAVSALEHALSEAGWGEFRRSDADRQYLAATKSGITLSFLDVPSSFDSVPPPTSVRVIISGPCTPVAAILAPYLRTVLDPYRPEPAAQPPLKIP